MKIDFLLAELERLAEESETDPETAHMKADQLLLDYINHPKIESAFNDVLKFYGNDKPKE